MNTGYKGWTILEQYDRATGVATGQTKVNAPGDPNYVAPIEDTDMCPLFTYTATRSQFFTRNNCSSGETGESILFAKTYTSMISQADADTQALGDTSFNTEGQAYANANGTCIVAAEHVVFVDVIEPSVQTGSSNVYRFQLFQPEILPINITVGMEIRYVNSLGANTIRLLSKTIVAGNTGDNTPSWEWDITDGSPAGDLSGITLLSHYVTPSEGTVVNTPSGLRILRVVFNF